MNNLDAAGGASLGLVDGGPDLLVLEEPNDQRVPLDQSDLSA